MRRARVLSRYGLHAAADRWEEAFGPKTPMAQAAPASCMSCGFLAPIGGSLGQAFGVCANEFSPADGRVVSLAYGCGGHSEAAVMPKPPQPARRSSTRPASTPSPSARPRLRLGPGLGGRVVGGPGALVAPPGGGTDRGRRRGGSAGHPSAIRASAQARTAFIASSRTALSSRRASLAVAASSCPRLLLARA